MLFLNEEIESLKTFDDAGEGSEVSITDKTNDEMVLDQCQGPATL